MFSTQLTTENNFEKLTITNQRIGLFAEINLTQGASLQTYVLHKTPIIKPIDGFEYETSYASSVLFPFVSRTKLGTYTFNGKTYQFECNTADKKTALHGFLYHQKFEVTAINTDENLCEVVLSYTQKAPATGYPFLFVFKAIYTFLNDELHVSFDVTNTGSSTLPFTIGWHPYFYAPNFKETSITFSSDQQIEYDADLVTKQIKENPYPNQINFANASFDDCWILNNNTVDFKTQAYALTITSNISENHLQIFTPPNLPLIAIEPMLGISNSLNNKIGLQILEPNQEFKVSWTVKIKTQSNEY